MKSKEEGEQVGWRERGRGRGQGRTEEACHDASDRRGKLEEMGDRLRVDELIL